MPGCHRTQHDQLTGHPDWLLHTRTSSESDFTLEVADEPTINPVLLYALAEECGADLDSGEFGEKMTALLTSLTKVRGVNIS